MSIDDAGYGYRFSVVVSRRSLR